MREEKGVIGDCVMDELIRRFFLVEAKAAVVVRFMFLLILDDGKLQHCLSILNRTEFILMRRCAIIVLAVIFSSISLVAQNTTCDCLENLNQTIRKTEENYAGFPAKVNEHTKNRYLVLKTNLSKRAAKATTPKKCYYVVRDYVRFFQDKHFILNYYNEQDFDSTVVAVDPGYWEKKRRLGTLAAVEGVWTNPDSTVKIGIYQSARHEFKAIKLESSSDAYPVGFVYFTLRKNGKNFIVQEYNSFLSTSSPARQVGNLLQLWNHALWGKLFPQTMSYSEQRELATWKNRNNGLAFRQLTPEYAYLKIPTFLQNDDKIQQLVSASDSMIRRSKYLIVDLRGNGGGNTGWIFFLPYFLTNAIDQQPSLLRVTPDNVKHKLPDLEPFVNNPISEEYKKYFPDDVLAAYKKTYAELPSTKQSFYPIPGVRFPFESTGRFPEKIALIVDEFCGSSSEYFFFLSKQSKKTRTYGANTIGMMDYEGMSTPTALPYEKFILTIPIAKSSWTDKHPIDQKGFRPDVLISLPHQKWIDFIMRDLPNR